MIQILCLTVLGLLLLNLPSATAENGTCARYGFDVEFPGVSCADIHNKNPASHGKSGYYVIETDHVHTVYCDMELECSGHKGGWMKIADYGTRRGDSCPSGWKMTYADRLYNGVCRSPNDNAGCHSTHFYVHKASYNKICGRVRGYQKGSPGAFRKIKNPSIDNEYVDGISITLGTPRKHVWTYAVGLNSNGAIDHCPCAEYPGQSPPPFVGTNYYCDSGNSAAYINDATYYTSNPLWDGYRCPPNNNCCTNINQPWFFRQMTMDRKDDIEVRLCTNEAFSDEAIVVEQLQIYVH